MTPRAIAGVGRSLAVGLLVLAAAGVSGCGGSLDMRGDFLQSVRRYHEDLRWARYNDATLTLAPQLRKQFLLRARDAENEFSVSDWEIFSADIEPKKKKEAIVQVRITWMRKDETVVKTTTLEQKWLRRLDTWMVVAEKRVKGPEFPLELKETADGPDPFPSRKNPSTAVPLTRQNNEN